MRAFQIERMFAAANIKCDFLLRIEVRDAAEFVVGEIYGPAVEVHAHWCGFIAVFQPRYISDFYRTLCAVTYR